MEVEEGWGRRRKNGGGEIAVRNINVGEEERRNQGEMEEKR